MDGEPGFVEHGCESKPDKAKNIKTHWDTSIGGRFSLDTFFVRTKKVSRSHRERKNTLKQKSEKRIFGQAKKSTSPKPRSGWRKGNKINERDFSRRKSPTSPSQAPYGFSYARWATGRLHRFRRYSYPAQSLSIASWCEKYFPGIH